MMSMICAMDRNNAIGVANSLPWDLPADMEHFKKTTHGKTVVMGRKTFDSIGRPLPGRTNVVLTRRDAMIEGCTVVGSISSVLDMVSPADEIVVIGGAEIYKAFLPYARTLYLTYVDAEVDGDSWFPAPDSGWVTQGRHVRPSDSRNEYSMVFETLIRSKP